MFRNVAFFTPLDTETTSGLASGWAIRLAAFALCVVALLTLGVNSWGQAPFSPDSWSYYELSQSVRSSEPYRIWTYRQFQFPTDYGTSFPPLFPIAIAVVDGLLDLGIYSGYILNLGIGLATLFGLATLTHRAIGDSLPGITAFALLMMSPAYVDEVLSGRSIPMVLLFMVLVLHVLLSERELHPVATTVALAVLSGLWILTRFDFTLAAVAFGFTLAAIKPPGKRAGTFAIFVVVLVLTIAPWILHSYFRFGELWVSDNARTVLSVDLPYVTEFLPFPEVSRSLHNTSVPVWVLAKAKAMASVTSVGLGRAILAGSLLPGILAGAILALVWLRRQQPMPVLKRIGARWLTTRIGRGLVLLLPALLMLHVSISLTGFTDERYHLPLLILTYLASITFIDLWSRSGTNHQRVFVSSELMLLSAAVVFVGFEISLEAALVRGILVPMAIAALVWKMRSRIGKPVHHLRWGALALASFFILLTPLFSAGEVREITVTPAHRKLAMALAPTDRVLFPKAREALAFGATTRTNTSMLPRYLSPVTALLFLDTYEVTHVVEGDPLLDWLVEEVYEAQTTRYGFLTVYALGETRPDIRLLNLDPVTDSEWLRGISRNLRAVRVDNATDVAPGARVVLNGSGIRSVTKVTEGGRVIHVDLPLQSEPDRMDRADGAPFPILALPPLLERTHQTQLERATMPPNPPPVR